MRIPLTCEAGAGLQPAKASTLWERCSHKILAEESPLARTKRERAAALRNFLAGGVYDARQICRYLLSPGASSV
ncbi:MAG TPA: hypothetical protein VNE00_30435 [Paraburkholderia sp.]|jgi:hypothetical protein|nr:hypothetical protein [Paraburkholderia sp.]